MTKDPCCYRFESSVKASVFDDLLHLVRNYANVLR
jgi:hypothetical protein